MDNSHNHYDEPDQLLDEIQLSVRWGISPKTLRNKRVIGDGLAYIKIGRLVRYRLQEITAFEEENLRRSTSEIVKPIVT